MYRIQGGGGVFWGTKMLLIWQGARCMKTVDLKRGIKDFIFEHALKSQIHVLVYVLSFIVI